MSRASAAFPAVFKRARGYIEASARNERATLDSVAELASDKEGFARYVNELKTSVSGFETAHLRDDRPGHAPASGLPPAQAGRPPALRGREKGGQAHRQAAPRRCLANGFGGYQAAIQEARKAAGGAPAPSGRGASRNAAEIQLLCDGKTSTLDIKKMLDTEFQEETPLEAVVAHLELLKRAGLVAF